MTWLGANLAGNSNNVAAMQPACTDGSNDCWAQWNVYAAESVDGCAAVPVFTQHAASDHVIHAGTVYQRHGQPEVKPVEMQCSKAAL